MPFVEVKVFEDELTHNKLRQLAINNPPLIHYGVNSHTIFW